MDINDLEIEIAKLELNENEALVLYMPDEFLAENYQSASDLVDQIGNLCKTENPIIVLPTSLDIQEGSLDELIKFLENIRDKNNEEDKTTLSDLYE